MQEDNSNVPGDTPEPTQPISSTPESENAPASVSSSSGGGKKNLFSGKKKIVAIVIAVIALLISASAGAYYLVYLPNTPQNILKKSAENTLKLQQVSGSGSASVTTKDSGAFTVGYKIQSDSVKNTASAKVDVAYSGVKLPFEVRSVDKAVYLKVGDLSTVKALATGYLGAESAGLVDTLSKQISDKWIEFDESLIKTATTDKCSILAGNNSISEQQVQQIVSLYDKNTFIDIKKTSPDTVNGQKVIKAELGLNKDKAKAFAKDAEQLDIVKKLKDCGGDTATKSDTVKKAESATGTYEFTVWVNKSKKEIVKMAFKGTDKDTTMNVDFTYNKDKVDVQKPEGAVPAMQLFGQLAPLLGVSGAGTGATNTALLQSQLQ